jgi:hypothetical protein
LIANYKLLLAESLEVSLKIMRAGTAFTQLEVLGKLALAVFRAFTSRIVWFAVV